MPLVPYNVRADSGLRGEIREILMLPSCPFKSESELLRESLSVGISEIKRRVEESA